MPGVTLLLLAQVYTWTSRDGVVHYTDDPKQVPKGAKVRNTEGAALAELKSSGEPAPAKVVPPSPPAAQWAVPVAPGALASALAEAEEHARAGRIREADRLLADSASRAQSQVERRQVMETNVRCARALLEFGKRDDAEHFFHRARATGEESADLYLLEGDLAFDGGDADDARRAWDRGHRLYPSNAALTNKLAELEKRSKGFYKLKLRTSSKVTVVFDGEVDDDLADATVSIMEQWMQPVHALYGLKSDQHVEVVLYPGITYSTMGPRHPDWSGGVFDGRIHVPTGGVNSARGTLTLALLHEYGHSVSSRRLAGRKMSVKKGARGGLVVDLEAAVPGWFEEGLAQVASGLDGDAPDIACTAGHGGPLKSMEAGFHGFDADGARASYPTARHAVERFIARFGRSAIHQLYERRTSGASFAEAFEAAAGVSYETFAKQFDERAELH